jgi:DNA-binding response OmpR family regulator
MLVEPASPKKHSEDPPKRVALIVEDDPRLRQAMNRELGRMNFVVLSANHCDAAIRHLETHVANIVCVDIALPDKSGYELCEYIRGAMGLMRVPILATGEYGTSLDMTEAEKAGANAFLLKPFSVRQLSLCVQSLLDLTTDRALPTRELARRYSGRGDAVAQSTRAAPAGRVGRVTPDHRQSCDRDAWDGTRTPTAMATGEGGNPDPQSAPRAASPWLRA